MSQRESSTGPSLEGYRRLLDGRGGGSPDHGSESERHLSLVSLTALAGLLKLTKATVRRLGFRPARQGSRGGEARYRVEDVAAELAERNLWVDSGAQILARPLLTPPEAAVYIGELLPREPVPSVQTLARWRYEGYDPRFLKICPKAVRYRPEDLETWAGEWQAELMRRAVQLLHP